ncbi:aromatic ring-opening dioxygenase [Grosmannia clavigera kw1407]|uniref:Aromatic ring-opening dioxygenase n=1 Tax=Grosmannia clavigera (strain kw1407 / UAMH 11150) TaxID=655863 RepID=F0XKD7_GROCL|nr:aromatic ring-opening dioxygenase [Grosmannia clavigera kw1407]EFX01977.1 aromatic ring-opening dioxygenase [Grosmannia clavigera kw1407]
MTSTGGRRMPVFFLGIGGPGFTDNASHPANVKLEEIGKDITTKIKPKAVVVFSAHWQESPGIKINAAEHTDLIYDFYGFPPEYYQIDYPNKGSPEIAEKVVQKLNAAGMRVEKTKRGLDHGIWVGFMAVSLLANDDVEQHYRIGEALESLRDEGIMIIGAGMAVHNLYDFRSTIGTGRNMPFDEALKEAATASPEDRREAMVALMKRTDARKAHPSVEHLLPVFVAAGAAGKDRGMQRWTLPEGSLSWAQYQFGGI